MEVGTKVKVKSVPGESLYQHFIGQVGKVAGTTDDGRIKVECMASPGMLFLDPAQVEVEA